MEEPQDPEKLLAQAKKADIASRKRKGAQKANIEKIKDLLVRKRSKKGKSGQYQDDAPGILLKTGIPQSKTTDIIAINYKSMPAEQCEEASPSCSYVR